MPTSTLCSVNLADDTVAPPPSGVSYETILMMGFIGLFIVHALGLLSFVAIARCEWTKTGSVTTDTRKTLITSGLGLVVIVPIALGFEVLL